MSQDEHLNSEAAAYGAISRGVSRETLERFEVYLTLLRHWQTMLNLVAPSTLDQLWLRHFADSNQIFDLKPSAERWVDFGSGGGFPGLIVAIRLCELQRGSIVLIESDKRKCAFLREVIRETQARGEVIAGRIEQVVPNIQTKFDVITARALAPVEQLLKYSKDLMLGGASGLFLKGKDLHRELTEVKHLDKYYYKTWPSQTDTNSGILEIALLASPKNELDLV